MDSDGRYKPDWITRSVEALIKSEAEITGLKAFNMMAVGMEYEASWTYNYGTARPFVTGATMCYWRSFWERNKFQEIGCGEDVYFVYGDHLEEKPRVHAHEYIEGFLDAMHLGNTAVRQVFGSRYRLHSQEEHEALKLFWGLAK